MRWHDDPVIAGRRRYSEKDIAELEAMWLRMLVMSSLLAWMMGAATVIALKLAGWFG